MAKKRSIGVTIFGWWYIIGGALGLLGLPVMLVMAKLPSMYPNDIFMKQCTSIFYIIYATVATIASLIAGIGLLKLKSWARKLVIILCLAGTAYSIFFSVKMAMNSSQFIEMSMPSHTLSNETSPETIAAMKAFTQAIFIGSIVVGAIFGLGFVIFTIWFFMRKSIVEQFQPENKKVSVTEQAK